MHKSFIYVVLDCTNILFSKDIIDNKIVIQTAIWKTVHNTELNI